MKTSQQINTVRLGKVADAATAHAILAANLMECQVMARNDVNKPYSKVCNKPIDGCMYAVFVRNKSRVQGAIETDTTVFLVEISSRGGDASDGKSK